MRRVATNVAKVARTPGGTEAQGLGQQATPPRSEMISRSNSTVVCPPPRCGRTPSWHPAPR